MEYKFYLFTRLLLMFVFVQIPRQCISHNLNHNDSLENIITNWSDILESEKQYGNQSSQSCWICDVVSDIGSGISNVFGGGLWKNTWGYYEEGGQESVGPYTVFSRGNLSHHDQVTQLRIKILQPNGDSTFYYLYKTVLIPRCRGRSVRDFESKNIPQTKLKIPIAAANPFAL